MSKTMGQYIRELRTAEGLSQEELGKMLTPPVNRAAVNKWETGQVENIKRNHIQQLAKHFGISPAKLMCFEDPDEQVAQLTYYGDTETAKKAQEMFEDPDMRSLFDMKKNMDPGKFQLQMDYLRGLYKLEHPEDSDEGC